MHRDFWIDESFSYLYSQMPNAFIMDFSDVHFPLFTFIAKGIQFFVSDPFYLRTTILILSLISVISLYFLANKWFDRNVANFTLFLYLLMPTMSFFNTEYRSYFLLFIFVPINLYLFVKAFNEKEPNSPFILYAITSALLIYIHYMAVFYLISQYLYLLLRYKLKNKLINIQTGIYGFIIFIFSIPAIYYFLNTLPKYTNTWYDKSNLLSLFSSFTYLFSLPNQSAYLAILSTFAFFCLILYHIHNSKHNTKQQNQYLELILFIVFTTIIVMFISHFITKVYHHRYIVMVAVLAYIFIAFYLDKLFTYILDIQSNIKRALYLSLAVIVLLSICFLPIYQEQYNNHINYSFDFINSNYNIQNITIIHTSVFTQAPYKVLCISKNLSCRNVIIQNLDRKYLFSAGGSTILDYEFNPIINYSNQVLAVSSVNYCDNIIYYYDGLKVTKCN